jgi:hypothetical protein
MNISTDGFGLYRVKLGDAECEINLGSPINGPSEKELSICGVMLDRAKALSSIDVGGSAAKAYYHLQKAMESLNDLRKERDRKSRS